MATGTIADIAPYYRGPVTVEQHIGVPGAVMLKVQGRLVAVLTYQEAFALSDDVGDEGTFAKEREFAAAEKKET